MKRIASLALTLLWLACGAVLQPTFAHGDEDHGKKDTLQQSPTTHVASQAQTDALPQETATPAASDDAVEGRAAWGDFPTMHPLVVHFPVVLLPVAFLLQLLSFFYRKEGVHLAVWLCLLLGFAGAWIAGEYVHPHTHGLSAQAQWVLDQHDRFADWTVWLSLAALVLKSITLWLRRQVQAIEIAVALVLAGAAWSVTEAGHYGAQLVHVEGVGPQGEFLE